MNERIEKLTQWLQSDTIKKLPIQTVFEAARQDGYSNKELREAVALIFKEKSYPQPDVPTNAEMSEIMDLKCEDIGRLY